METWKGYHFSIESDIKNQIFIYQISYFNEKYYLQRLDSSIKYINDYSTKYTFFVDNPNDIFDLFFCFMLDKSNIKITPFFKNHNDIKLLSFKTFILENKCDCQKENDNIYVDFLYDKDPNINFIIFDLINFKQVFPKLFYNKFHQIESKISLISNNEYIVFTMLKIKNATYFQICKLIIDNDGKENLSSFTILKICMEVEPQ